MLKTDRREIDGVTFEVTQLGFAQGRRLFLKVSRLLGPALAGLAKGPVNDLALASAVQSALATISDEDLEDISETLGTVTRFSTDGIKNPFLNRANRETLFAGAIFSRFVPWIVFALEVQFADFSDALKGLRAPALEGKADAGATSQKP